LTVPEGCDTVASGVDFDMMLHRQQRPAVFHVLALCLVAAYLVFSTYAASCMEHQLGASAHHHAGQTTHHHTFCGETQCSASAIATDGQLVPADLPRLCGAVVAAPVLSIIVLFTPFAASRAPPSFPV